MGVSSSSLTCPVRHLASCSDKSSDLSLLRMRRGVARTSPRPGCGLSHGLGVAGCPSRLTNFKATL